MSEMDNKILLRLRRKPAKKDELVALTNMSERYVRKVIARLRQNYPIINLSDGSGYKLATTKEELNHFKNQEYKRAFTIINRAKAMQINDGSQEEMRLAK